MSAHSRSPSSSAPPLPLYLCSPLFSFFLSLLPSFLFFPHRFSRDKFKCALDTREKLVYIYILNEYEYHSESASQPHAHAHAPCPMPHAPRLRVLCPALNGVLKNTLNSLAFALYLPNEIDAFSFSGPEQFS